MNKKALRVLEYHKIKELLAEKAGSALSRKIVEGLEPGGDIRDISDELRSTTEAVDLIVRKGPLPSEGLHDIAGLAELARKGGTLAVKQLIEVSYDLRIAARVVSFLKGELPEIPMILSLAELIVPHEDLSKEIDRVIVSEDEIADDASSELLRIRRSKTKKNEQIRSKLSQMISSRAGSSYLQDSIVTIRDGRYVIPVKQEYRNEFPGIVHDQSKGGATLFIEPKIVVDLNNDLRELELAEEAEIAKIIKNLSDRTGVIKDDIRNNQEIIARLDFIMAKGKLSVAMKGEEPKLDDSGVLDIKEGRHPLLDSEKVVPIDISMGKPETDGGPVRKTLVITGPNTGGKTVTLKTAGLLTLMALSGLHIPASSESRIPVYKDVYADIGDEQSIEQSLSTFSSHMKNIVYIAGVADGGSLVLLDELGAGTDPTEGAALAVAILERLKELGATTIATTHYNELKKYALSTDGVENASMEFNVDTLSPTYRLLTGVAGKSNAFDISKKLGLSGKIIRRAEELIEQGDLAFEDVLGAIEQDRAAAARDREEAERLKQEIEDARNELEKKSRSFDSMKDKLIRDAKSEAREIIRDAQETADDVRKDLRSIAGEESFGKRNRIFAEARHKLNDKESEYAEKLVLRANDKPVKASELKAGDRVRYIPFDQTGEVVEPPDKKGEVMIMLGTARMNVKLSDLAFQERPEKKDDGASKAHISGMMRSKSMTIKREVDVRGENLDDALMDVGKYIDDAAMAHLDEATIIHGRGEGILKEGIRRELKSNKHVKSLRPGEYNEGGDGVTVVTLK